MPTNSNHIATTHSYFFSKPYLMFWACLTGFAVYLLGSMVYTSPELVFIFGPVILLLLAVTWPLLKDLLLFKPKLVVTSDRIFYEGWPFKKLDLRNIKKAYVASLASDGASRIHLEVANEDELLKKYGFLSRLTLKTHRASGSSPIVINLTMLKRIRSQELIKAINERIAIINSAE